MQARPCAQRQEEENNRWPKEAYLSFVDLRALIEKNWQLFEAKLRAAGALRNGRTETPAWIVEINERYRRMMGHPLKMHVTRFSFSQDDLSYLAKYDAIAHRLRHVSVQGTSGS